MRDGAPRGSARSCRPSTPRSRARGPAPTAPAALPRRWPCPRACSGRHGASGAGSAQAWAGGLACAWSGRCRGCRSGPRAARDRPAAGRSSRARPRSACPAPSPAALLAARGGRRSRSRASLPAPHRRTARARSEHSSVACAGHGSCACALALASRTMAVRSKTSGGPPQPVSQPRQRARKAAQTADEQAVRRLSIDTIRGLAMDAVQKANAGHPGTAMALAPLGYTLFRRFLRVNPTDTQWPDRDRFVLSAGHACILQYSLLHLCGYELAMEDLEQFRQWGSRTPGHPERGDTPGVEVTTGPLGQGFGNAVGMALAERFLADRFNRPGHELVDHHTYVICSDGDLMEGVTQEAASIAGHFRLGKLIVCYDDNHITIDGSTAISFDGEDHCARMRAEGWHVQQVTDSEDLHALEQALAAARQEGERPSFIAIRSHIAYPAPHAVDTAKAHGAPLGEEEVRAAKQVMGFDPERHFWVDERVYEHMSLKQAGERAQAQWSERLGAWRAALPDQAAEWDRAWQGRMRDGWQAALPSFDA